MIKKAYISGSMALIVLLGGAPIASAQSYFYSPMVSGCLTLTAYQQIGSTDAATGGQVTQLQQYLNRTGYLNGVTGYFDAGTYGAVVNFQRAFGIVPTGTVGPLTRSTLNAQSCNNSGVNYQYNYGNGYNNGGYTYGYPNYYAAPTISSLSATSGYAGTVVTVYGTNLLASNTTVHIGGSTVGANSTSNGSLTFTVPSLTTGSYSVYVSNAYGTSNSISFTVTNNYNCYTYTYGDCSCGPIAYQTYPYSYNYNYNCTNNYNNLGWYGSNGQPRVSSITGQTSLSAGTSYTWSVNAYSVNGLPVTLSVDYGDGTQSQNMQYGLSNQQYSFSHVYTSNGSYTIRVTATDSSGNFSYSTLPVSVYGYSYNTNGGYYNYPTISYLSNTSGYAGTNVTIYGSNFNGNVVVLFGNSAYNVYASNGSSVSFTVPSVYPGSYSVQVRNGNGMVSNSVQYRVY